MKKLYDKSEWGFALAWIAVCCVGMPVFDEFSRKIGVESSASAVFAVMASLFLFFWLKKHGKLQRPGLCHPTASPISTGTRRATSWMRRMWRPLAQTSRRRKSESSPDNCFEKAKKSGGASQDS